MPSGAAPWITGSRSSTMVAWVRSWRAGLTSYDEVIDELRAGDGEHLVTGLGGAAGRATLSVALAVFSRLRPDAVRLVLPTFGDPRGLPGPGPFTNAALAAGEAVIGGELGLVPAVTSGVSGSGDEWRVVDWRAYPMPPVPAELLDLPEAEHDLLMAIREATDALRRLDVARAAPDLGPELAAIRDPSADLDLPPGYGARSQRVLARSTVVTRILGAAAADAPGGAVTAYEAAERDAALRPLATAARRARMAAINAPLE